MKKLILLGYMASGKSFVGQKLAKKLGYNFIDLDDFIEINEQCTVREIFEKKGELYFRKAEKNFLQELLNKDENLIIALGGGTPCYYTTMEDLTNNSSLKTIYLKVSIQEIIKRVTNEKSKRPLIAHLKTKEELTEFISKHLFERSYYYNKANFIIDANGSADKIIENIIAKLF